jgi:hypothetical protein
MHCPHEPVPKELISSTIINYHLDTFKILSLGAKPWHISLFFCPAQFLHRWANFSGSEFAPPATKFCWLKNFSGDGILLAVAIPCHTLHLSIFNTDLSIYGPQACWLHYHDGDNGGSGGATRFALRDDDDVVTGDALWGILFGMHLVNLQETQVVCCQEHPCFEGHTMVGIVLEAMAAVTQDLLCAMMMTVPLVMPFVLGILFGMCLVNLQETQVVCHQEHPCFKGHTRVGIILETMAVAAEDLLCAMMMTMPLVIPFVWGVLFGMGPVNSQETQVVCH